MYQIFESQEAFIAKNNEIMNAGVCGNATEYANVNSCKHPTLNKWAMPVRHYVERFFNDEDLVEELDSTWNRTLNK